jgi:hypothetical protein
MTRAAILAICIVSLAGCAREAIPKYPDLSESESLRRLQERAGSLRSASAEGSVRLTQATGESVRLDLAMALQFPDHARVRTWKFGQAVLDVTLLPDGLFVAGAGNDDQKKQLNAAGGQAGEMIRRLLRVMSGTFQSPQMSIQSNQIQICEMRGGGASIVCEVDRRTLTIRRCRIFDDRGVERFSLTLDRYIESAGQVWPTRIAGTGETGAIQLELRDVELNGEIPEQAFHPPARAEKAP